MRWAVILSLCVAITFAAADVSPAFASSQSTKSSASKRKIVMNVKHIKHVRRTTSKKRHHVQEDPLHLALASHSVLVQDQSTGTVLFEKNAGAVVPIASITKLMTAMVVLEAKQDLQEMLEVSSEDVDTLKGSSSRLRVGTSLSREDMLRLALMSSENRAAHALARYYPGGLETFVSAMNVRATLIGLSDTHFEDPTGLMPSNVSSARDLVKMVGAASKYPLIRELTTTPNYEIALNGRPTTFRNTNTLVRNGSWEIGLSKTGFINESGRCLVMQAWLADKPMIIVLLDSWGRLTRVGDANRIKRWLEAVVETPSDRR